MYKTGSNLCNKCFCLFSSQHFSDFLPHLFLLPLFLLLSFSLLQPTTPLITSPFFIPPLQPTTSLITSHFLPSTRGSASDRRERSRASSCDFIISYMRNNGDQTFSKLWRVAPRLLRGDQEVLNLKPQILNLKLKFASSELLD